MSSYFPSLFLVLLLSQSEEFSSILLVLITLMLVWVSTILSGSGFSLQSFFLVLVYLLSAAFVTTSSLLMLYISFEGVLAPMFFLILTFGYSPEKVGASLYLLAYTVIGSFPFLVFTITSFGPVVELSALLRPTLAYCLFITFGTKTPLFWLHAWLPKAHTEAPLFGSILLSGVLLKLGSYGMFLLSPSLYLCSPLLRILCLFGAFVCSIVTLRC
jgi:NADH:ubiquinone oxidoreductase subunit 4 (subunit M)